jgi:hypothetical protein
MPGLRPRGYRRPRYLAGLRYDVPGVRITRYTHTHGGWFYFRWTVR